MRSSASVRKALILTLAVGAAWAVSIPVARSAGAPERAPGPPVIAYSGRADGFDQVWTARLDGTVVQRFRHPEGYGEPWTTISGGVVAVTQHNLESFFGSRVHLYDARTGDQRSVIGDARYPLITWGGTGVMFAPDNLATNRPKERDPYVRTVWFRDLVTGRDRRLARIRDPDLGLGQLAASPTRNLLAFTEANDTFLFEWNIVLVEPDGGRRLFTRDGKSLSPSFSPDGRTIAMEKDGPDVCSGSLATKGITTGGVDRFFRNSCEMRLSRPVWIDDHRVVAQWRQPHPAGGFSVSRGLVIGATRTGEVSDPIVEARVTSFAVSRERGIVGFRTARGSIGVYDLASPGGLRHVPGGRQLPGTYLHLDGAYELSP